MKNESIKCPKCGGRIIGRGAPSSYESEYYHECENGHREHICSWRERAEKAEARVAELEDEINLLKAMVAAPARLTHSISTGALEDNS